MSLLLLLLVALHKEARMWSLRLLALASLSSWVLVLLVSHHSLFGLLLRCLRLHVLKLFEVLSNLIWLLGSSLPTAWCLELLAKLP